MAGKAAPVKGGKGKKRSKSIGGKRFTLVGSGTESKVFHIGGLRARKKGAVIRSPHTFLRNWEGRAMYEEQFLATKIAHELFPKNTIKVTAFDRKRGRIRSKLVEGDKVLEDFQTLETSLSRLEGKAPSALEHKRKRLIEELEKRKGNAHVIVKRKRIEAAGFKLDRGVTNISVKDPKEPLFYEIESLDPFKVRNYLAQVELPPAKRRRVEKLLNAYERLVDHWGDIRFG